MAPGTAKDGETMRPGAASKGKEEAERDAVIEGGIPPNNSPRRIRVTDPRFRNNIVSRLSRA